MILETYQEEQALAQPDPPGQSFAVVGTVYEDGIALIFNGSDTESLKHYKCNACVRFEAGQRVRIIDDSGTYVVEYPVGSPAASIYADNAGHAAYAAEAGHSATADKASTATKADLATTAGTADNATQAGHAAEANHAAAADTSTAADTATNANQAARALQIDNQAANIADLVFYYATKGTLYVRATADSNWTKLTGTVVSSI